MRNIYSKFATDKNLEQAGIVLDFGDGVEFKIARAGGSNVRFEKAVAQKMRKFELQRKHDNLDPEQMRTVFREVLAETVVLGWKGVTDREGNELPFTRENCIKLFTDLPDLLDEVLEQSRKSTLFKQELLEDEAKNSQPS